MHGSPLSPPVDPTALDPQLRFLEDVVAEHATVAGDIIEIDTDTWAIHGTVALDGDVILAEYHDEHDARRALAELARFEHTPHRQNEGSADAPDRPR
jgi:hypothetical protein